MHWRSQCPKFLRQIFVEWTAQSIPHFLLRQEALYKQQRAKDSSRQAALRALAHKWIRILYRYWQDRIPYEEATHSEQRPRTERS